jgi:hypothetical protein
MAARWSWLATRRRHTAVNFTGKVELGDGGRKMKTTMELP